MDAFKIIQLEKSDFYVKNTILRSSSRKIDVFDSEFQKIVNRLIFTLEQNSLAIGLAAPQINIPIRLAVVTLNKRKDETLVLVNPEINSETGKKDKKKKSCMSLPHYRGEVTRRRKIQVAYQNRFGVPQTLDAEGFFA